MAMVSIVVPAWGETPHLNEMRSSIAAQTFNDYEVIVCSPPRGAENAGAARNAGLDRAKGEWIYFADADDRMKPELLSKAVAAGGGHAGDSLIGGIVADIVVFGAEEFDDATSWKTPLPLDLKAKEDDSRFSSYGNCVWNKLFRTTYLREKGIRFQEQKRVKDLAFVIEALARTDRIAIIDDVLYEYRINNPESLQAGKFADTANYAASAVAECERRLVACGKIERFRTALENLRLNIASNNRRGVLPRIVASIRNRGLVSFAKHSIGKLVRRFA